jgi:hypothetical protein
VAEANAMISGYLFAAAKAGNVAAQIFWLKTRALYGARRFVRRLNELGISHRYEEFADNHSGVDYRMDESLPFSRAGARFGFLGL